MLNDARHNFHLLCLMGILLSGCVLFEDTSFNPGELVGDISEDTLVEPDQAADLPAEDATADTPEEVTDTTHTDAGDTLSNDSSTGDISPCPDGGALNSCGGCTPLEDEPGTSCGTCSSGEWVCEGTEALYCAGDDGESVLNDCGGCADLSGAPGDFCGPCAARTLTCADDGETLFCGGPELGETEDCTALDCLDLLELDVTAGDGIYWIDPDGDEGENAPFEAYCDMTHDGGGWTLIMVSSDDGQDTWTWNNQLTWTSDTATFGSLESLNEDFKSRAFHEVHQDQLLFIHNPSAVWAAYYNFNSGEDLKSFSDRMEDIATPACFAELPGWPLSAGTLTQEFKLCDTSLYVNAQDQDGNPECGTDNDAFGPNWSVDNGSGGCPMDDPGISGSLGPDSSFPDCEHACDSSPVAPTSADAVGFGWAIGENENAPGEGVNYMSVYVRRELPSSLTCEAQSGTHPACPGLDCQGILDAGLSTGDGSYWIDPDGEEGDGVSFEVYCDMTTDGGGWTLMAMVHTADIYDVDQPRTWFTAGNNPTSLPSNSMTHNSPPSSFGVAPFLGRLSTGEHLARFVLHAQDDPEQEAVFYKAVELAAIERWFEDDTTETAVCRDLAMSEECTTGVISQMGGVSGDPTHISTVLGGMVLSSELGGLGQLHMVLNDDPNPGSSGVCSYTGNSPYWADSFNEHWGNGLRIWLR